MDRRPRSIARRLARVQMARNAVGMVRGSEHVGHIRPHIVAGQLGLQHALIERHGAVQIGRGNFGPDSEVFGVKDHRSSPLCRCDDLSLTHPS